MLNSAPDTLSKEKIISYMSNSATKNIVVLETVNSTNAYAKELATAPFFSGTTVIANHQTNGRGRLGRDFFSPENTGIYMSILLDPKQIHLSSNLLTVAAGVAVCRVLQKLCPAQPAIKWVNDIFINGKKVCGILAEGTYSAGSQELSSVVVGIGINISTPDTVFPGELGNIAGSVFPENISRNQIIAGIINEFYSLYMSSDSKSLIKEYESYQLILGKKISFSAKGEAYEGTAVSVNYEGNLIVVLDNGEEITLKSGEISLGSSNFIK